MRKEKMTISVTSELADYLRSTPNASSLIAEAVSEYRTRRLEEELEAAYREDAAESERLAALWGEVDAELPSE